MPTDIFMKIRDIQGESRDKDHKDEIEVLSWSWGLSNQVASPSPGGGAGAGKTKFQDISFTHLVDKASPNLMLSCASGKHTRKPGSLSADQTPRRPRSSSSSSCRMCW